MNVDQLLSATPTQIAVFFGLSAVAGFVYFALIRAGNAITHKYGVPTHQKKGGKKNNGPTIVPFFPDPNALTNGGTAPAGTTSHLHFKKMVLVARTQDTHDTIVLRFALAHHGRCTADGSCGRPDSLLNAAVINVAGIAPTKHVQIRADINGEVVQRSFSPTSCAVDEAHCGLLDLHVKVYRPDPSKGLSGGVMSCYLDSLAVGSTVEMRGPTGLVQYAGNGAFLVGTGGRNPRKVVAGKHLVLIAGGSGITPIIATLKAILHGKLGGMRVPTETITSPTASSAEKVFSPTTGSEICDATASPLARREYLKGECRHSFYEHSPTSVDESSNAIERITFIYANHTIGDIMFKDWLLGDDKEHSCYGAFAALAEVGQVAPADEAVAAKLPNGFAAKAIDVSMNYFVTRPTPADTKAMAAANKVWTAAEEQLWGLPTAAADGKTTPRSRSSGSKAGAADASASTASQPGVATKTSAIVTRRYVSGRPSEEAVKECMAFGGSAASTGAIRAKFAAEIAAANVDSCNTVALLCGPNGLLDDVARPALLAAGVPKERILLA